MACLAPFLTQNRGLVFCPCRRHNHKFVSALFCRSFLSVSLNLAKLSRAYCWVKFPLISLSRRMFRRHLASLTASNMYFGVCNCAKSVFKTFVYFFHKNEKGRGSARTMRHIQEVYHQWTVFHVTWNEWDIKAKWRRVKHRLTVIMVSR